MTQKNASTSKNCVLRARAVPRRTCRRSLHPLESKSHGHLAMLAEDVENTTIRAILRRGVS